MKIKGLSERFNEVLKYTGLSQVDFAKEIGVHRSYISRILSETNRGISNSLAFVIEEKFGVDSNWLLTGKGEMIKMYSKSPELNEIQQEFMEAVER